VFIALFEGLTVLDPVTCEPQPGAAEKWDVSADGTVYTFHLRPNNRWSNGDAVTAEDFVYSMRRILAPGLGAEYANFLHHVKNGRAINLGEIKDASQLGVRAVNPHTLEVTLEQPVPYFPAMLTHQAYMPVHRATVEKFGRADDRASAWTKPGNLVGNGPFVLQSWLTNQRLVTVKNPHYRAAAAVRLNAIEFMPIENAETGDRSFRAGQVHVTDALPLSRIPGYREARKPEFVSHTFLGTGFMSIQTERPPFNDARVRRAFSLALDRKTLVERVSRGGQVPAGSFTPPGTAGFQPPLAPLHDVEQARRLLAEAGFPEGRGLAPIEATFPQSDNARALLEAMQEMWRRDLGVRVELGNVEWKVFLDRLSRRDYQIGFMSWIGDYIDPNTFLSIMISGGGNNRTNWSNQDYDALIARADRTMDRAARLALFAEAERILAKEQPIIPLWHLNRTYLLHSAVRGFTPNLLDLHPYQHIWLEPAAR
jgi:oligopeptide transport system substrate-binding protein